MDLEDATDFWGLRVRDAAGEHRLQAAAEVRAHDDFPGSEKDYTGRAALVRTKLIAGKTYVRKLDLAKLYDLSKPGIYEIQLRYACPYWAGEGRTHWTGSFGSAPVTITVRAR